MVKEILLIDDDKDDLQFFCDALEAIDPFIKCRDFTTCMQALDFFTQNTSGLPIGVFIDLSMPKMDGKQCLMAMTENELLRDIPKFIISGIITDEIKSELTGIGVVGFVTKPDNFKKLKDEISSLLPALYHQENGLGG